VLILVGAAIVGVTLLAVLIVVLVTGSGDDDSDDTVSPAPADQAPLPDEAAPPDEIPGVPPEDSGPAEDAATTTLTIGGSEFRFTSTGRVERFPLDCVEGPVCTEAAAGNVMFLIEMTTTDPIPSDSTGFDSAIGNATDLASLTVDGEEVTRSVTSIAPTEVTLAFEVPDDADPATFVLHLTGQPAVTGFEELGA
jgi:hypothetical protein